MNQRIAKAGRLGVVVAAQAEKLPYSIELWDDGGGALERVLARAQCPACPGDFSGGAERTSRGANLIAPRHADHRGFRRVVRYQVYLTQIPLFPRPAEAREASVGGSRRRSG